MTNSRVHRNFRQALLRGDVRHVQHVVNGHAKAQKLSQQDALADLMCYIYEDDCHGSGILYLAAGCKLSDRKLMWWISRTPGSSSSSSSQSRCGGRRPCVFDHCFQRGNQHNSSSSSSGHNAEAVAHSAAAAPPAAAAAGGEGGAGYPSVFRGWFSSSSSRPQADPDAGRVAILSWMSDVMSHSNDVTWLPLDLVNTRLQTALHLCLLNIGSPNVLKLLLDLSSSAAASSSSSSSSRQQQILQRVWGMTDAAGYTPLDLAIRFQDWQCAGLMIAAGAAAVNSSSGSSSSDDAFMAAAEAHVAGLLPGGLRPRSLAAAAASSSSRSGGSGVTSLVGGLISAVVSAAASSSVHSFQPQVALSNLSDPALQSGSAGQIRTDRSSTRSDHATVHSSNVAAVADELKQAVEHVSYVTNVPPATALSLLATNGYDLDQAIKAASGSSSSSSRMVGSSNVVVEATSPSSSSSSGGGPCIVCFESIMPSDQISNDRDLENDIVTMSVQLPCGHVTCDSCWRGITTACVEGLGVQRIGCPAAGCGALLPLDDVERLGKPEVYQQYLSLLVHHVVNTSPQRQWCPAPDCGRTLKLTQQQQQQLGGSRGFDVRCACGCEFCWSCQEPAHEPADCRQVIAWRQLVTAAAASAEHQTADWVAAHTRCCPRCHTRIQKDGGCNHMTCRVCSREFCWVCGRDWSHHSQSTGGYYACTLQPTAAAAAAETGTEDSPLVSVSNQQQQQQQLGSLISSLLGSAVTAVKNVVLSHKQKLYLGMYLQHELDLDRLKVLLMYQQLLLAAVLWQQQQQQQEFPCMGPAAAAGAPDRQQQQEVSSGGDRPVGLRSLLHVIPEEQQQQQHGNQQQQQIFDQLFNLPPIPPPQQQQQRDMHVSDQQQLRGCDLMSDDLRSAWLQCVSSCKHTLRWSCVQGYNLRAAASRRQPEHLQDRLAEAVDQLLAVIQQLPGAQLVVERVAVAAARRAAAAEATGYATRTARSLWGRVWQQLGCNSSSSGGGSNRAPVGTVGTVGTVNARLCTATSTAATRRDLWFEIPANLLEEQVYYVLAVSERFSEISDMINQAYLIRDVLLSAARQGVLDDQPSSTSSAAAAVGSSNPGDVSQGPQVTFFDVVAAGSDPEVLYDAVSAGVGQIWRSLVGGR